MTETLALLILNVPKVYAEFTGGLNDALNFGFSYVETEDRMVEYVMVSPRMALRIFREIHESILDPDEGDVLGAIWTAKLMCSKKVRDDRIVFVNESLSTALMLELKPEQIG